MNRLRRESNAARESLMRETGLSDLDYQLLILNTGCQFQDAMVERLEGCSDEMIAQFRQDLSDAGYWDFWTYSWRTFEVSLVKQWANQEALVLLQGKKYKRNRLLQEAERMCEDSIRNRHLVAFDCWLKDAATELLRMGREMQEAETQEQH